MYFFCVQLFKDIWILIGCSVFVVFWLNQILSFLFFFVFLRQIVVYLFFWAAFSLTQVAVRNPLPTELKLG